MKYFGKEIKDEKDSTSNRCGGSIGFIRGFASFDESRNTEPATDELLRAIPAESLFCIRINNFEYTLSQVDQFLAGVSPLPIGLSVLVRQELAGLLGSPQPSGIDMAGSFAFFATIIDGQYMQADPMQNAYMVLLVPVGDYEQFVRDNPNVRPPDEQGISKITSAAAGEVLVTGAGSFALFTLVERYDQLLETARSIRSRSVRSLTTALDAAQARAAATEPIWAYINAELAADSNIPVVAELVVAEEFDAVDTRETLGPGPEGVAALQLPAPFADSQKRMKDIRSISLTARPARDTLNIGCTISARPGTETARMFTADSATIRELAEKVGAREPKQIGAQIGAVSQLLPQAAKADFVGTYDLTNMLTLLAGFPQAQVSVRDASAKSGLAFAVKVGGGKMDLDMALPRKHLSELADSIQMVSQQFAETAMSEELGQEGLGEFGTPEFDWSDTDFNDTGQEVKLVIVGVTGDAEDAIKEKLKEITDGGGYSLSSSRLNDRMTVHLSPVKDVEAFAKKIDFGKVTDTNLQGRTIWVELTETDMGADEGAEIAAGASKEGGLVMAKLRRVDFPQMYGKVHGGYKIPLVLKLPARAVALGEGKIESAVTITDKSLLPKQKWDRDLSFPELAADRRTVEFVIELAEPNEAMVTFKEVSGTLEYFTATISKKLDSGLMDFTDGVESEEAGFSIDKIGPPEWDPKKITMKLKVDMPVGAVKSSKIYTEDGRRLDVSHGSSWSGDRLTGLSFSLDSKFPHRGKIVLEIYEDVKKHEARFRFTGRGYLDQRSKGSSVQRGEEVPGGSDVVEFDFSNERSSFEEGGKWVTKNKGRGADKQESRTGRSLFSYGPKVVRTVPVAFANDVSPALNKITFTFDTRMKDGTWSWTEFDEGSYPEMLGDPFFDRSRRTCTRRVKLRPATAYIVGVNYDPFEDTNAREDLSRFARAAMTAGFMSTSGKKAWPYALVFATEDESGNPTPIPENLLRQATSVALAHEPHLLETNWGKRGRYAKFAPSNASLGSWAVALSQILYFHRLSPKGTVSYQCTKEGYSIGEQLDKNKFRWKLFANRLSNRTSSVSEREVAKYLYCTAVVIQRDFGAGGYILTRRDERATAIASHYVCQTNLYDSRKYSLAQMKGVIMQEIDARRPLVLCLRSLSKKYTAVVVDSYCKVKGSLWIHINMGRNGFDNGWYDFAGPVLKYNDNNYRKIITIKPTTVTNNR
ncbi:MAG: C10 family peptidase [Planctomycetota bacterium]